MPTLSFMWLHNIVINQSYKGYRLQKEVLLRKMTSELQVAYQLVEVFDLN